MNKSPETDEELLYLEEELRKIIYKTNKTTAFENFFNGAWERYERVKLPGNFLSVTFGSFSR